MPTERIGLLGGSFNPPHRGHVAIAEWVLQQGKVNQVWVIPCWEHPLAKPLATFEHRFQMCVQAFEDLQPDVPVLDVEKKLGGKSYTYRTVAHLKKTNPGKIFYLIVGQDVAEEIHSWEHAKALQSGVEMIVIPRGQGSPVPVVSATEVREQLETGKGLEQWLPKPVIEYILEHKLYK